MPALYPPLVPSRDTPGAEPDDRPVPLVTSLGLPGSRMAVFLGFWIVVDLEAGFAETINLGSLPQDNSADGADQEPSFVQPLRCAHDKQDRDETHDLNEIGGDEHADSTGLIVPAYVVAYQEADAKEQHHQHSPEGAGESPFSAVKRKGDHGTDN